MLMQDVIRLSEQLQRKGYYGRVAGQKNPHYKDKFPCKGAVVHKAQTQAYKDV